MSEKYCINTAYHSPSMISGINTVFLSAISNRAPVVSIQRETRENWTGSRRGCLRLFEAYLVLATDLSALFWPRLQNHQ